MHQLINNPAAKATRAGKTISKPLKFIIMGTTFLTIMGFLLFWNAPKNSEINESMYEQKSLNQPEIIHIVRNHVFRRSIMTYQPILNT